MRAYIEEKSRSRDNVFLAVVHRENDKHIGNIKLGPIDWIHRRGDVGIIIGDKNCWGKGFASEAIGLMADYAFNTLNLHKLTAGYYSPNRACGKAFEKNGFVPEGVRKQHAFYEGTYVDLNLLGLVKDGNP